MPKYHDCLRVVDGLPEALAECAGVAEMAAKLLEDMNDHQASLVYYSLCLLKRRLHQMEQHFEPQAVQERMERDMYRRTYIRAKEMSHEI